MSAPPSQTQWYLARDGQQFGPLSEAELAKFIDLGHLQPTDLLWRDGFPDWRPALVVFPQRKPQAAPRPMQPPRSLNSTPEQAAARSGRQHRRTHQRHDPRHEPAGAYGLPAEPEDAPRRRGGLRRTLLAMFWLAALGAAGWYGYPYRAELMDFVKGLAASVPASSRITSDDKSLDVPPLKGFSGPPETLDAALQATALWRVIKRDYPEWYAERLKEAAALAAQNKDDAAIGQQMARGLVALRRQNVNYALAASFPKLKAVASTFFENLVALRKQSSEACFEFISQGEASATIVALLQGSAHVAHLQAHLTAVFEAAADGRKSARVYPQPRKTDYDALAADLTKLGWSPADMQLFSDERALARAAPDKVCQLVHDWFAAQLALKDADMQLRLLVDSLKPVVAG
jgi:hypothetical protein